VLKLSPSGTVVYSTFLAAARDIGAGIAVDSQGNAYVAGATLSKNFRSSRRSRQRLKDREATAPAELEAMDLSRN